MPRDLETAANRERWVSVKWEKDISTEFDANLHIVAHDSTNLLLKLATLLAGLHIPVHSLNARDQGSGATVTMTIAVNSVEHLRSVIQRLEQVQGVDLVQRATM